MYKNLAIGQNSIFIPNLWKQISLYLQLSVWKMQSSLNQFYPPETHHTSLWQQIELVLYLKIKEMWLIYERLQAEPNLSKMVIACHSQEFKIQSAILSVTQRIVNVLDFVADKLSR